MRKYNADNQLEIYEWLEGKAEECCSDRRDEEYYGFEQYTTIYQGDTYTI